jgi:hypothetical protein
MLALSSGRHHALNIKKYSIKRVPDDLILGEF